MWNFTFCTYDRINKKDKSRRSAEEKIEMTIISLYDDNEELLHDDDDDDDDDSDQLSLSLSSSVSYSSSSSLTATSNGGWMDLLLMLLLLLLVVLLVVAAALLHGRDGTTRIIPSRQRSPSRLVIVVLDVVFLQFRVE